MRDERYRKYFTYPDESMTWRFIRLNYERWKRNKRFLVVLEQDELRMFERMNCRNFQPKESRVERYAS